MFTRVSPSSRARRGNIRQGFHLLGTSLTGFLLRWLWFSWSKLLEEHRVPHGMHVYTSLYMQCVCVLIYAYTHMKIMYVTYVDGWMATFFGFH